MSLWFLFAVMTLVAVAFVAWPLHRQEQRFTPLLALTIIGVVALSAGLYYKQGQPEVPSGTAAEEMDDVVAALAERLEGNPEDINGWKMLGRSFMSLGDFQGAADAFSRANELEGGQDAQTLVSLAEAQLSATRGAVAGDVAALFESALAIDPNNPQALFYGGIAAFNRADQPLAADRWERLLSLNPPPEIQDVLRQRIAEWRGQPVATVQPAPSTSQAPVLPENPPEGAVVSISLSLSEEAQAAISGEANIFIIARDPAAPSPPIAVTRRQVSELPALVHLGDRESMVPGRELSGFAEFELVARVSLSGQPSQQSGDWFGSVIVTPAKDNTVNLTISEQAP